jgi:putative endonuclease
MQEHRSGQSNFTNRYNVHHLIWTQEFANIIDAIQAEKRIKRMTRYEKELLIQQINPDWVFLE